MTPEASPAALWEGRPARFWRAQWRVPELLLFNTVPSTNDVARTAALHGAAAGTVVLADHQSAGRGRFGRRWEAAPGSSLLLSLVLRPDAVAEPAPGALPLRIGLAAALALRDVAGIDVAVKWPNDLVLRSGAKLGGILCEAVTTADAWTVIAGLGINVRQQPDDWPAALRAGAASLDAAAGRCISRADVAGALSDALRPLFTAPLVPLDGNATATFAAHDLLAGRAVRVWPADRPAGAGALLGTADGVDADGALLLVGQDGTRTRVTTGTVRLAGAGEPALRPPRS